MNNECPVSPDGKHKLELYSISHSLEWLSTVGEERLESLMSTINRLQSDVNYNRNTILDLIHLSMLGSFYYTSLSAIKNN